MGTRGAFGFYKNGENKITYNHWDSYPEGLGKDMVTFVKETGIKELNQIFDRIQLVSNQKAKPTEEQIKHCEPWTDLSVSHQSEEDWYCLLRGAQGDLNAYKKGLRYMDDGVSFMASSLFNEWSYIVNLDENVLEIYEGFNKENQKNRYSIATPDRQGYFAVKHIISFPLDDIPDDWEKQIHDNDRHALKKGNRLFIHQKDEPSAYVKILDIDEEKVTYKYVEKNWKPVEETEEFTLSREEFENLL